MLLLGTKTVNTQTVATNGVVNLGAVYRKYCKKNACGIPTFAFDGNNITLNQRGMYKITVTANVSATAAGDVTLQLAEGGTNIISASATETITTANTEVRNMTIDYIILVDSTILLNNISTLAKAISVVNTGTAAIINSIVVDVVKVL